MGKSNFDFEVYDALERSCLCHTTYKNTFKLLLTTHLNKILQFF